MASFTVHFGFSQRFPFPVTEAYAWCTDFDQGDIVLEGMKGSRRIEWTDADTVILTDTVEDPDGQKITKVKVVRLYPHLLMWTNTRVSEPGRYSQFVYQIVSEGANASRLDYNGAQIEEAVSTTSSAEIAAISKRLASEDSLAWVNLAAAMKKDLAHSSSRQASGTSSQ